MYVGYWRAEAPGHSRQGNRAKNIRSLNVLFFKYNEKMFLFKSRLILKKANAIGLMELNYFKYRIGRFVCFENPLKNLKKIFEIFRFSMKKNKGAEKKIKLKDKILLYADWSDAKHPLSLVSQFARCVQKTLSELANARESAELRLERQQQNTKGISFSRILRKKF